MGTRSRMCHGGWEVRVHGVSAIYVCLRSWCSETALWVLRSCKAKPSVEEHSLSDSSSNYTPFRTSFFELFRVP